MSALSTPTSSIMNTMSRVRLVPACAISSCPAQAVTPVASSPALSTNSEATKIVAGSPKPASAWFRVRSPLAQSAIAQARQTMTTGNRSHMNSATTAAMMAKTIQMSLTSVFLPGWSAACGALRFGAPAVPSGPRIARGC